MLIKRVVYTVGALAILCAASARADGLELAVDKERYTVGVSGCFENVAANAYVTMAIYPSDMGDISADDEWHMTDEVLFVLQTQADKDGGFSFPQLELKNVGGNYTCAVGCSGSDNEQKKEFFMPSADSLAEFIREVNTKSTRVRTMLDEETVQKQLGINVDLYGLLNDEGRVGAVAALCSAAPFDSIAPIEKLIMKYSAVYGVICADNAQEALAYFLKDSYEGVMAENAAQLADALGLDNFIRTSVGREFYTLSREKAEQRIWNAVERRPQTIEDFYDKLELCTINDEIQRASGYNEINGIINKYSDCLDGFDVDRYNSFKKRSVIDKRIFEKAGFDDKKALCDFITQSMKELDSSGSSPSGGSGGGGGGSSAGSGSIVIKPSDTGAAGLSVPSFYDLEDNHWAADAIKALAAKGIISGRPDGGFAPSDSILREEFAAMIFKASGQEQTGSASVFYDVDDNAWYCGYVMTLYDKGIIRGNTDGSLGAGRNITRQDMAVILARAFDDGNEYPPAEFSDSGDIAGYAADSVNAMAGRGSMSGYPDGSFAPQKDVSRAEAAVVIYKLLGAGR